MRRNPVKHKLRDGGVALGTMMFEFASPGIGPLAAAAGAEFAVFDMEHTGWSVETIRLLVATSRGTDLVPIVRVPATEYHYFARVLDMGAMGIMVPMVETEAQARTIVSSCKYPPRGRRGAAFVVAHDDYRDGDIVEKMQSADDEQLLIAQIETARGLENVEQIAAVDGIDVLWIGHFDLSNSLGIPGQFDHPQFLQALTRVLEACERHQKTAGFLTGDVGQTLDLVRQGFRCIAYGVDSWMYRQTLADSLKAVRDGLSPKQ